LLIVVLGLLWHVNKINFLSFSGLQFYFDHYQENTWKF
jgi:hypothetical protein